MIDTMPTQFPLDLLQSILFIEMVKEGLPAQLDAKGTLGDDSLEIKMNVRNPKEGDLACESTQPACTVSAVVEVGEHIGVWLLRLSTVKIA